LSFRTVVDLNLDGNLAHVFRPFAGAASSCVGGQRAVGSSNIVLSIDGRSIKATRTPARGGARPGVITNLSKMLTVDVDEDLETDHPPGSPGSSSQRLGPPRSSRIFSVSAVASMPAFAQLARRPRQEPDGRRAAIGNMCARVMADRVNKARRAPHGAPVAHIGDPTGMEDQQVAGVFLNSPARLRLGARPTLHSPLSSGLAGLLKVGCQPADHVPYEILVLLDEALRPLARRSYASVSTQTNKLRPAAYSVRVKRPQAAAGRPRGKIRARKPERNPRLRSRASP